jgi:putative DNA primase/helicase
MDSHCLDLRTLQAALGGDIVGRQVLCPGPNHSTRDRSLAVKPTASGGIVVHSFAGDDWRDCQDYVRERLGWRPDWRLVRAPPVERIEYRDNNKIERAKTIWSEGQDPRGTLAEQYLAARKLHLPADLCGSVLRYHPRCPWQSETIPCLIAAFTSIEDDEISAIHRVRLDQPERWPKTERRMLGAVAGSAIKLDAPGDRLAIAEGLESALAARQLGFGATWALGSARTFLPVDGVNELVILGEHDEANRRATEACSKNWSDRRVFLSLPTIGKDFNDYLMGRH